MTIDAMISVQNYHKRYGGTLAVENLSFDVSAGSILGMLGPNGAGKTTTLRAIAGIIRPTGGHLHVDGRDVTSELVEAKQNIAFVPDDPQLFDLLTVWEHLEFIATAYRVADYAKRAEELLEQFEVTEKRDVAARELSRGMRQKVPSAALTCIGRRRYCLTNL